MEQPEYNYNTVVDCVNSLKDRGYTADFALLAKENLIICGKTSTQLSPEDFAIDATYRFEGNTDPGDEMVVFAISAIHFDMKGYILNAFGMYADESSSKLIEKLKEHL